MRTAWGYEIDLPADQPICPLVTMDDFNERTNMVYINNPRAEAAVIAASQAVRNYCGWHISPSMRCLAHPVGGGMVLRLPAGYLSSISEIHENGEHVQPETYEWRSDGLIRKTRHRRWTHRWDGIDVWYRAGYEPKAVPDLAEAVCAIAAGVLAVSAGVTSESADGVSISYAQSASSIAAGLTWQQKQALEAYKVVNAHGA